MSLDIILKALRRQFLIASVVLIAVVLLAIVYATFRTPKYTATISMYVAAQPTDNVQQAFQASQLSEQRVRSYLDLVTDDRVLEEAIARNSLGVSSETLRGEISASTEPNSLIIRISVELESPQLAASVANSVAEITSLVASDLDRPLQPGEPLPVSLKIIQPASVPSSSSSTAPAAVITLGFLAGILLGIAAAILKQLSDTRVKDEEDATRSAGCSSLGSIRISSSASKIVEADGLVGDLAAEDYRRVRTNLQYVDVDRPRRVISFTSAMPGEGKTTVVANLAVVLAAAGSRVAVVDADLRRPRLAQVFGIDGTVGLTQVLAGRVSLMEALQPIMASRNVVFLPSGAIPPNPSELLGSQQMQKTLAELRSRFDFVLVDSPPLLPVADPIDLALAVDATVLLCRYGATKSNELARASATLRAAAVSPLGFVMTMTPAKWSSAYGAYSEAETPTSGTFADSQSGPSPRPRRSQT